ncbi:acetyl-CoA carboxylase, biotin carboxyl carrier protein [bacterium]|nr:MAG: acetyl-CoA carboxylase, biotin carboxyl carrier protein [bacterium]
MNIDRVKELLALLEESELEELEIEVKEKNGAAIKIRKGTPEGSSSIINSVLGPSSANAPHNTPPSTVPVPTGQLVQEDTAVAEAPADESTAEELGLVDITSPIVGTFYRASAPDADPYVRVGDHIEVGQVVCIVEAMKLMNEIQSEVGGEVVKILAENAQPVEFGQVLFQIKPL